jgi:hypothetical protein
LRDRRGLEDRRQGQVLSELVFDRTKQFDGEQRMAAEVEEVVVKLDSAAIEHALPDAEQGPLHRIRSPRSAAAGSLAQIRCRRWQG